MFRMYVVNRRVWSLVALVSAALLVSGVAVTAQGPQPQGTQAALGSGFTYQGQLKSSGAPVNGSCDIAFRLYDAPNSGNAVGTAMTPTVAITNGLFTTLLDFGSGAFNGDSRWLDMQVRCPAGGGAFSALSRQQLSAAPYALYSIGNWGLNGNGGTTASNFLGTTDNMSLTLGVSGTAALRLVPIPGAPIIIGGYSGNRVGGVSDGATIGGGGSATFGGNVISGTNVSWSTIGGGVNNRILGNAYNATISGGYSNTINPGGRSVIGGGYNNSVGATAATIAGGDSNTAGSDWSTVSGGRGNKAANDYGTVGGGVFNTASGYGSMVPGGNSNVASRAYSFAAGWSARALHDGAFVWADNTGAGKPISSTTPNQFIVRATGGITLVTAVDGSGNPTLRNVALSDGSFSFGAATRQMLNLWSQVYGIGVQGAALYFRSDGGFDWFQQGVHSDATDDPGSGGTRLMRLDGGGNLHVLGTVSGGGADLAERIVTSDTPQPGEVVEIDPDHPGQFRLAASANSSAVAGVVSTHPGVQLNQPDDGTGDGGVQLALAGRVPVKVSAENGAIRPGDLLVASGTPGHAMCAPANPAPGTIIGKALGRLDEGTGVIEMLVMLR